MAQFDVYRSSSTTYPLLLDVQADAFHRIDTHVVVPMVPRKKFGGKPISKLNPLATIGDMEYVLLFQALAAYPAERLTAQVGTLRDRRPELIAALDLLFTGS